MSPSKQNAPMLDTPESSLKREKFEFNSVIEKYIALAHGLPPPPNTSPQLQTKHPLTTPLKRQHASTGKITKKSKTGTHLSRKLPGNVPRTPSSSIEEEIAQEVEESLSRRIEELGLPDDYVLKEIMDKDLKCYGAHHSAKKNNTHNSLTASKRNKESSKIPRKRVKLLEDVTNSKKSVSHSQRRAPKRKVREEIKELYTDVILNSPELKKKVKKINEGAKKKKSELSENISPNRRAKERNRDPNFEASDENEIPRKNVRNKKSLNRRRKDQPVSKRTREATAQDTERENSALVSNMHQTENGEVQEENRCSNLFEAMKKAVLDKIGITASVVHMVQEKNDVFCLFDNLECVHFNLHEGNERESQTEVSNTDKERTSTSSEEQHGRVPAGKRTKGESEGSIRRGACTKRTSTLSEQQSGRVPANKKRKEAEKEQSVRDAVTSKTTSQQQTVRTDTSTTPGKQSVTECANKKRKEPKPEQAVRSCPVKEKISTSKLQSTKKQTLEQKTDTTLEEQNERLCVNKDDKTPTESEETESLKEKAITAAAQLSVKLQRINVSMNSINKTETKQDEQTKKIQNSLHEKANTAQQTPELPNNKTKETDTVHTVAAQGMNHKAKTKDNQNTNMQPSKLEKTGHGKCQSTAACTNEKIDTDQQKREQGTVRQTKQACHPATEVDKNTPENREIRSAVAKRCDSQEVQVSVPSEAQDISEAAPERRVTRSNMTGTGMQVTDAPENTALPSSPRNVSQSSTDSSYHLTRNSPLKKSKFAYLSCLDSEDEDSDWSTFSLEDDTLEELNVKKRKRRKRDSYQLLGVSNKKRPKRLSKSSHKADDEDDDKDIIIMTSLNPPILNNGNNTNVVNTVTENHTRTRTPYGSHKKISPTKNWMVKSTLERLKGNSFSKRAARCQQKKMESLVAAEQSTDEGSDLGDTWNLPCLPPVKQNFSHLSSRVEMSSQGSQCTETSSIQHQVTATTSRNSRILTNTFVNYTTSTTTATMVSQPSKSFWVMPSSEEEADNRILTSTMMSESTMQSQSISTSTSQMTFSRRKGLPDYRTLGPERWLAAARKLQKSKSRKL